MVLHQPTESSLGTTSRALGLISALCKAGVDVTLFTPYIENLKPEINFQVEQFSSLFSNDTLSRIFHRFFRRIYYSRIMCPITLSGFAIERYVQAFARRLKRVVMKYKLDALQGEQDIAALACLSLRNHLPDSVKITADLHSIWPDEMASLGLIRRNSSTYRAIQSVVSRILSEADFTIVVSEEMRQIVRDSYECDSSKVVTVPPGCTPRIDSVEFVDSPRRVMYPGMLSKLHNPALAIESIPLVKRKIPDAQFFLTAKGDDEKSIKQLVNRLEVQPTFTWFYNRDKFFEFLEGCHLGIIPSVDRSHRYAYPSKFFDCLSVGVPVVAVDIGGWTEIIKRRKLGLVTGPTPKDFAGGIIQILQDSEFRYKCAQNAINQAKTEFSWEKSAQILLERYSHS
jgi:glycosyltransferase involved in cell wall biosynthesis